MEKTRKKRRGKILAILGLLLLCLLGIAIAAYPMLSERYLESVRSEVHAEYQQLVESAEPQDMDSYWQAAREYNAKLARGEIDILDPGAFGYNDLLAVPGSDIMAFVKIPRLNVSLPIYHGCSNEVLDKGCGHLAQTSLPVGGASTHSAISAHTGMASSPMFSDLELLEPGDIFQIEVLGETLTYQIQSYADIQVVLPNDTSTLFVREGEDLVTLITCTPFGVNSHRLLVTGHRIDTPETEETVAGGTEQTAQSEQETGSVYRDHYIKALTYAGFFLIAGIVIIVIVRMLQAKMDKKRGRNGNRTV